MFAMVNPDNHLPVSLCRSPTWGRGLKQGIKNNTYPFSFSLEVIL
jgi:hypothetical protein